MEFTENSYTPAVTSKFVPAGSILNYVWDVGIRKEVLANGKLEDSSFDQLPPETMAGGRRIGNVAELGYVGGKIGELIFLTESPSEADRQRMEVYLAHKWGLTANLLSTPSRRVNAPPRCSLLPRATQAKRSTEQSTSGSPHRQC